MFIYICALVWTVAHQASQSRAFPRQGYWNGLPFPSPGIFLTQGSNPGLLHYRKILYCWATRVLRFMWSQRVRHDWETDLIWYIYIYTHVYIHVYIHTHMYIHTHTHTHIYIYKYIWASLVVQWWRICLQFRSCRFNPWVGKIPTGGNGNPLQYSCLWNPMDRGAWRATHEVAKSRTQLSN